MAFGGGGGKGPKSDINVTPLVDVVLVLLIIFLVAMPIVLRNIELEVPKKLPPEEQITVEPARQTTLEVTKAGAILLDGVEINRTDLATKLREKLDAKREKVVFVGFDDNTRYGDAVSIMDTCKGAGAKTVALKMADAYDPGAAPPGGAAPEGTPPAAPAPAPNQ